MRNIFTLLMLLPIAALSQVTIKIESLPTNTPANAPIHFAGNINGWNPGDPNYILQTGEDGNLQITIPEGNGSVEYKFTRGSWATVEGNSTGGALPNRSFTFTGSPQTINVTILTWEDLAGGSNSTAASNVQIISNAFAILQLNTTRRVWLYLPPDYETSGKNYPVLYMQDGQNLFDNATSFSGEWQVDETMNSLFANGDYGAIVVGIDNGGSERLNEYSPWVNPQYGGGDGDQYMIFLANTLKPYIDANYRTRPEPEMNALIGSSMGALIATYGSCEFPDTFRKVGSMSPAYWFSISDLNNYIVNGAFNLQLHRMYFVAGTNESANMVSDINTIRTSLISRGLSPDNALTKFDAFGQHNENYWKGEFAAMYQWLFANENLALPSRIDSAIRVVQLDSDRIWAEGLKNDTAFKIITLNGVTVGSMLLSNGISDLPAYLPAGLYIMQSANDGVKPIKICVK